MRLTVAQALIRFLANQYSERDGVEQRLIAGCFGIFGHGNVAGVGQALLEAGDDDALRARPQRAGDGPRRRRLRAPEEPPRDLRVHRLGRPGLDEHGHRRRAGHDQPAAGAAAARATSSPRASPTRCCRSSRTRRSLDVSRQRHASSRSRASGTASTAPSSSPPALLAAMRVLTDPAETGAVTLALPQDVQAEAYDWPEELFERRVWHVRRAARRARARSAEAAELLRGAQRPLIVSGGGTIYAEATDALRELAEATGIPVAETQAGKGSLPYDHPQSLGAIGATGTTAANAIAREADVDPRRRHALERLHDRLAQPVRRRTRAFINLNVARVDAFKHAGAAAGRRRARRASRRSPTRSTGWSADAEHTERAPSSPPSGTRRSSAPTRSATARCPPRARCSASVNRVSGPRDVVVCAAGSMPGDLHKLWRTRDPKGYHVEYGFSCMGYEIAGGLGVKLAAPDREVFVMVGDGSFLMMAQEIVTAVAGGRQAQRSCSSRTTASPRSARCRESRRLAALRHEVPHAAPTRSCRVDWPPSAASARRVRRATTLDELEAGLREPRAGVTVVQIETDPLVAAPELRGVVGRAGRRGLRPRLHARRARDVRARTSRPSSST